MALMALKKDFINFYSPGGEAESNRITHGWLNEAADRINGLPNFNSLPYRPDTWTPAVADVPNLPASKVTSGEFAQARIPTIPQAKVESLPVALSAHGDAIGGLAGAIAALEARLAAAEAANRRTGWREWNPFPTATTLTTDAWRTERIGPVIYLTGALSPSTTAAVDATVLMPPGFRPRAFEELLLLRTGQIRGAITLATGGQIYVRGLSVGSGWRVSASWITADAWPTSLPGSPA